MESNNIEKEENSIDLKNIGMYLISKWWIILSVTVVIALGALLYTKLFITPAYSSTSEIFIINLSDKSESPNTSDWSIGKQLARTAPKLFSLDFCEDVADTLNNDPEFIKKFGDVLPDGKISASTIKKGTLVTSDDETSTVTFTVVNKNNELAAAIVNAISVNFGEFAKEILGDNTITTVYSTGRVSTIPYNIHPLRNMAIAGAGSFVVACIVLIVIFIFNGKIRTPDDIEKQLKISVLGTIPNFENKE